MNNGHPYRSSPARLPSLRELCEREFSDVQQRGPNLREELRSSLRRVLILLARNGYCGVWIYEKAGNSHSPAVQSILARWATGEGFTVTATREGPLEIYWSDLPNSQEGTTWRYAKKSIRKIDVGLRVVNGVLIESGLFDDN